MKTHATTIAALALAFAGAACAAGNHGHGHAHEHRPAHGGVVAEVRNMDYELVARPDGVQLYVSDHGKPADVSKASAKVTLLTGADKQEVELQPAGDRLEASGSFKVGPGTKAVAVVTIQGKPATARFTLK